MLTKRSFVVRGIKNNRSLLCFLLFCFVFVRASSTWLTPREGSAQKRMIVRSVCLSCLLTSRPCLSVQWFVEGLWECPLHRFAPIMLLWASFWDYPCHRFAPTMLLFFINHNAHFRLSFFHSFFFFSFFSPVNRLFSEELSTSVFPSSNVASTSTTSFHSRPPSYDLQIRWLFENFFRRLVSQH